MSGKQEHDRTGQETDEKVKKIRKLADEGVVFDGLEDPEEDIRTTYADSIAGLKAMLTGEKSSRKPGEPVSREELDAQIRELEAELHEDILGPDASKPAEIKSRTSTDRSEASSTGRLSSNYAGLTEKAFEGDASVARRVLFAEIDRLAENSGAADKALAQTLKVRARIGKAGLQAVWDQIMPSPQSTSERDLKTQSRISLAIKEALE